MGSATGPLKSKFGADEQRLVLLNKMGFDKKEWKLVEGIIGSGPVPELKKEDVGSLFSMLNKMFIGMKVHEATEPSAADQFEQLQEDIVGCNSLVSFGEYDMDAIADSIAETQVMLNYIDPSAWSEIIMPMIRKVFPQMIAHDICGVQPMTPPSGELFQLKDIMSGPPYMQGQGDGIDSKEFLKRFERNVEERNRYALAFLRADGQMGVWTTITVTSKDKTKDKNQDENK